MKRTFFFTLLFLLFLASSHYGQSKKFLISVHVNSPTEIKSDIESYLNREIRSLGDAEPVSNAPYRLYVNVMKVQTKSGVFTGYAVSYEFIQSVNCNGELYFDLLDQSLFVGSPDDLRKISEDIVTGIDKDALDSLRKKK